MSDEIVPMTDNEARNLLAILKEINHPTPPTDRAVDVCTCGCGAWKEKGTPSQ